MTLLASYPDPAEATLALDALRRGGVVTETRTAEENGLEFTEIHVQEDGYDRACGVIERHDEEVMALKLEEHRRSAGCPSCGSLDLKVRNDLDCSGSITGISYIMECGSCGRLIPR